MNSSRSLRLDPIVVDEDAAAHDVEDDVGEVVGCGQRLSRKLEAVRRGNQCGQLRGATRNIRFQLLRNALRVVPQQIQQRGDLAVVLVHVGDQAPTPFLRDRPTADRRRPGTRRADP